MLRLKKGVENMKRFYALMLAMVLILSSFVFSACSSQDGGTDTGNGQGSSNNISGADQNKVDNTDTNTESAADGKKNNGNDNVVEELSDDAKRTVDDVMDAGQR